MSTTLQLPQAIEAALQRLNPSTSRRNFLASSGALVLSLGLGTVPGARVLAQAAAGPYPDPDFLQLDTWIVIHPDNTATFFVGKTDGGQGTGTAFRQMMCDELDLAYEQTSLVMGSTDTTPDQGGSGGSDAIETDGKPMRRVAAEARRVLLELAAERLNTPVAQLTANNGIVTSTADAGKSVRYADLVGGKRFDVALTGQNINATTGTVQGRAILPNPDGLLQPGLFGRIRLPGSGLHQVVLVPDEVIQFDQSRQFVFVINPDGTVERRWVTTGPMAGGMRILRDGLDGSELVAAGGFHRMRAGMQVTPQLVAAPAEMN